MLGLSFADVVSHPWEVIILLMWLEHESFVWVFAWLVLIPLKSLTEPKQANGSLSSFGDLGLAPVTLCISMAVDLSSHASVKSLTCRNTCVVLPLCFAW